jgi:hypothetical protein
MGIPKAIGAIMASSPFSRRASGRWRRGLASIELRRIEEKLVFSNPCAEAVVL